MNPTSIALCGAGKRGWAAQPLLAHLHVLRLRFVLGGAADEGGRTPASQALLAPGSSHPEDQRAMRTVHDVYVDKLTDGAQPRCRYSYKR